MQACKIAVARGLARRMLLAAPMLLLTLAATPGAARAELKVVVTIKPVHALVAGVMEGAGVPTLLVSGRASPHTFALKPSDARALNAADVFFRVSEAVEPFTAKIIKSLPASVHVVTLADAPGVETLGARTGGTFEPHVHEHTAGSVETIWALSHGEADDHDHGGSRDGHIWLDPENAKAMVAEIARVLAAASPGDAPLFERNAARVTAEIDALEAKLSGELQPVRGKPFVVFHDAYQYFERRFGLDALGSITVSPESAPSARRLIEIRRKIKALGAVCVFGEPQFSASLVDAVAEGTGARTGMLDPEGALVEPGPNAYGELMGNLAAGFVSCLGQGS